MKRLLEMFLLCCAVLWAAPLRADKTSTPEERKWAVEAAKQLEEDPLGPQANERRTALLKWWTEVPDLTLNWCANLLTGELENADKGLRGAILLQAIFAAGAVMIEHPEIAGDKRALAIAGLEGALRAYRSAVTRDPRKRNEFLESLSKDGALAAYVDARLPSCK